MEIHEMVFLVSRATNSYASYRGKPVKFDFLRGGSVVRKERPE